MSNDMTEKQIEEAYSKWVDTQVAPGDSPHWAEVTFDLDSFRAGWMAAMEAQKPLGNTIELLQEDIECIHMKLDDIGAPRTSDTGKEYSVNGRISWVVENTLAVIKIAQSRKFTRDYTPEDDHLIWLYNNLSGNGPRKSR